MNGPVRAAGVGIFGGSWSCGIPCGIEGWSAGSAGTGCELRHDVGGVGDVVGAPPGMGVGDLLGSVWPEVLAGDGGRELDDVAPGALGDVFKVGVGQGEPLVALEGNAFGGAGEELVVVGIFAGHGVSPTTGTGISKIELAEYEAFAKVKAWQTA